MNKIFPLLLMGLLFLSIIIFVWTVFPSGQSEIVYRLHSNTFPSSEVSGCDYYDVLYASEFVVDYPKVIDFMESDKIIITAGNSQQDSRENLKMVSGTCSITLEVWIDAQELLITPGNRSYQLYTAKQDQNFRFEITPLSKLENIGTIWIFAHISEINNAKPERIPLFVIPFTIQTRSFFRIAPKLIRIYCLSLIFLSSILLVLLLKMKDEKREMI